MKKKNIIIFIVLVIVAIALAVFAGIATFNLIRKDKSDDNTNTENKTSNSTIVAEYRMDTETQYSLDMPENEIILDTKTEVEPNTGVNAVPSSVIYEINPDVGATDKKQAAIELVKKEWGEDNTVSFRCDHITENGEYMIAVTSLETATVKNYFRVNLENKTVEVEY